MPAVTFQDHKARAASRLLSQFRRKGTGEAETLLQRMVRAMLEPTDELETALLALLNERHINAAVGQQLDNAGALVEESRLGRNDDDYRLAIKARIAINTSKATPPDVVRVARLLTPDGTGVNYYESSAATITLDVYGYDLTTSDVAVLNNTRPGGVKLEAASTSVTPFAWQAAAGEPQIGGHFANGTDTDGAGAFVQSIGG